ncbi:MAG: ROK family protein [Anaerolineae bacterium]|nr:ROK family protein [Anaerolineae bacterium]
MTALYASIDLGGTKIAGALAGTNGQIVAEKTIPTESQQGPEAVVQRIAGLICDLAAQAGQSPVALGIGVPGLIDLSSGTTRFLPNFPTNWRDVPVRDWLVPQINCPVYLLNDARMAALGELTYGCGRSVGTMIFFTLGTGIGGGVVVDGRLRLGRLGAAGELGHHTILPDGPRCGCGNRGCLETLASGPAIVGKGVWLMQAGRAPRLHALVEGNPARVTPREMALAAEAGDEAVREELIRAAQYIGIGVANVVVTLHPEMVVLGGNVAGIGALLFDTVRQTVRERVGMFPTDDVAIVESALGNRAGLLGGIALAAAQGMVG